MIESKILAKPSWYVIALSDEEKRHIAGNKCVRHGNHQVVPPDRLVTECFCNILEMPTVHSLMPYIRIHNLKHNFFSLLIVGNDLLPMCVSETVQQRKLNWVGED